jgi:hypothetical protein
MVPLKLNGSVGPIGSDRRSRKCQWIRMRNQIQFILNTIQENRIGRKPANRTPNRPQNRTFSRPLTRVSVSLHLSVHDDSVSG